MIYTICYLSNKDPDLTDEDLAALFQSTEENNKLSGVTGTLLYMEDNFLQVLEGAKETLVPLFKKIKIDPRHKNVIVVLDKKHEDRIFDKYKSGFSIIKSKSDLKQLKTYLNNSNDELHASRSIAILLEPFLL